MSFSTSGKVSRKQSFGVSCEVNNQQETFYTCPENCRAEIEMLFVVNANGNTTVHAVWYDTSEAHEISLVGGKNMSEGEYILLPGVTLVLEAGDMLKVTPSGNTTPHIDAMCTVVETFIPVG